MTELDEVIAAAFNSEGRQEDVNKVYLALLRTNLFLPVNKNPHSKLSNEEPFQALFVQEEDHIFMLVFDTLERLQNWAGEYIDQMDYVEILGKDVIGGIGENVHLGLNFQTNYYKEFSPDEVKRLKMIVSRISQWGA